MRQCPRCLKWFKDIGRHTACSGLKSYDSGRDSGREDEHSKSIPEKMNMYGDKLSLGFAMLADDYED